MHWPDLMPNQRVSQRRESVSVAIQRQRPRVAALSVRQSELAVRPSPAYAFPVKAEFTAIIEAAAEGGYWAICPEVPGANGQGETVEETKKNLVAAIELILEDRRADALRGLPDDALQALKSTRLNSSHGKLAHMPSSA